MNKWSFFVQNGWIQDGKIQDSCHYQVESESMSQGFFVQIVGTNLGKWEWFWEGKLRKLNANWQNSRWLPSSSWVRMNEFESDWIKLDQSFVQHGWIQDGRIQDGCHHLVSWIELVWIRVRVERECFWVNLREDNKVSESKMAVSESNMAECRMAASSHWVGINESRFFCANSGNQSWQVWVSLREKKLIWLNANWQNSRLLPSSSWVRMNEFESDWISLSHSQSGVSVFFEWIWEKITRCLNPRWQCLNPTWQSSRWLPSSSWVRINESRFFLCK